MERGDIVGWRSRFGAATRCGLCSKNVAFMPPGNSAQPAGASTSQQLDVAVLSAALLLVLFATDQQGEAAYRPVIPSLARGSCLICL
jgi:hypothetical protein